MEEEEQGEWVLESWVREEVRGIELECFEGILDAELGR